MRNLISPRRTVIQTFALALLGTVSPIALRPPSAARADASPHNGLTTAVTTPAVGDALVYNGTLWANRPAGVASVRDHGVVGDGTADDTVALQAAFNAAQGGALALVRGETYRVTDSILVPEGTTVLGNGAEIKFVITGATKCLDVRSRCRIYDLKSNCQVTSPMGNTVFHCPVVLGDTVPDAVAVRDVVLENIELVSDRVGGNLMGLFGDVSNVRIRNVYIPATSTPYIGILLHWGGDTTLSDDIKHPHAITIDGVVCDGLNSGHSTSSVIFLSTPFSVSVKNVYARNVDSLAQISTGTYGNSKSTAEFDDIVLYGISIRDCVVNGTTFGVKVIDVGALYSGDFQITFDNIRLYGNDTGTGLDVQRCRNLVWSNCHIEKFVHGVRLHAGAQGVTFQGGTIRDIRRGGITGSATSHRHRIYGMTIEDINQDNTAVTEGSCIEVEGNGWVIRDCTLGLASGEGAYFGIAVMPGSERTLIDNVDIRDVGAAGNHLLDDGTGTILREVYPNDGTFSAAGSAGYLGTSVAEAWRLHRNGIDQTGIVSGAVTKVLWSTAAVDTNTRFDDADDRVYVRRSGVYFIAAALSVKAVNDQTTVNLWVHIDGARAAMLATSTSSGPGKNCWVSGTAVLNLTAGQHVEIFMRHDHGTDRDIDGSVTDGSSFYGHKIA